MAESQEFFDYDTDILDALCAGLSPARLEEYLSECHDDVEWAVRLYLWNSRLAKAYLFPLQICEVFTRNAIDAAFTARWGRDWVLAPPFPLNRFSRESHQRTIARVQRDAKRNDLPPPTADDVVAALTFDFWSNLFRPGYNAALWKDGSLLPSIFPRLSDGQGRPEVQLLMASVNALRNRIAHHEPIHNRQDHGAKLNEILTLIGLISPAVREWVRLHSTVITVVKSPPSPHSRMPGRPLAQSNLRAPKIFDASERLSKILPDLAMARPAVALMVSSTDQSGYSAVTAQAVAAFTSKLITATGGLIDYSEHSLADVVQATEISIGKIDHRSTTGDAMAKFYPGKGRPRSDLLIVEADGTPIGLLQRPDARF